MTNEPDYKWPCEECKDKGVCLEKGNGCSWQDEWAKRPADQQGEWRRCALHPSVRPDNHWGCPDCLFELRSEESKLRAHITALETENTRLREALEIELQRTGLMDMGHDDCDLCTHARAALSNTGEQRESS